MARRKITIEEALRVIEEAGIPLQPKPLDIAVVQSVPKQKVSPAFSKTPVSPKDMKVVLFAKHSIGTEQYGPGACIVPTEIAPHLLHADNAAKQADEKMLDRKQRSYMIVPRVDPQGRQINVSLEVSSDLFGSTTELGSDNMYIIG